MTSLPDCERDISDADFARFSDLIRRETGIFLSPAKKALLVGRVARRLRTLGMGSYLAYYRLVTSDPAELTTLINCICTHETHFFREPKHFDRLENELCPAWAAAADAGKRPRRLRVWSAACSSGEEPYSIAMSLLHQLGGWDLEVLATDLSTRVLELARQATWPIAKASEIPAFYRRRFMLKGTLSQEGTMRAGPELREVVQFQQLNLCDEQYPAGPFDLIFCRNVLIYFDAETKRQVVARLQRQLAPGALLLLGHAESFQQDKETQCSRT